MTQTITLFNLTITLFNPINAFYNMSVDTYKIFSLAASKFKDQLYFQKGITQDQDIFRVVINREEVENIFY
jgi:hypothetical protein